MRKIAVITSSAGECADRLVSLFNEGNRIRVELIVSDGVDAGVVDRFSGRGVEVIVSPRKVIDSDPEELVGLLSEHDIELVALDGFDGSLPEAISLAYAGKTVVLTSPEDALREVVAAFARIDGSMDAFSGESSPAEAMSREVPPVPKSVDEEWADKLHLNYDPSRLRSTPPPIPRQNPVVDAPAFSPQPQPTPYMQRPFNREPMPPTYLVWAILMAVFCCTIPGIIAIIFSAQVSSRYAVGNIEGARRSSRNAEIWIIVSFVLGIISAIFYFPVMMLSQWSL